MRLEPIHVTEINGVPLRHYPSLRYLRHGSEDFPWHDANDLRAILGIGAERPGTVGRLVSSDWSERMTVETPDGVAVVAPRFMAEKIIAGTRCRRTALSPRELDGIRDAYRAAALAAKRIMEATVPPGTTPAPQPVPYDD